MLDGESWRTLPAEVVLRAGLDVGVELDRERARRLRRELKRHDAMSSAARALPRNRNSTAMTMIKPSSRVCETVWSVLPTRSLRS